MAALSACSSINDKHLVCQLIQFNEYGKKALNHGYFESEVGWELSGAGAGTLLSRLFGWSHLNCSCGCVMDRSVHSPFWGRSRDTPVPLVWMVVFELQLRLSNGQECPFSFLRQEPYHVLFQCEISILFIDPMLRFSITKYLARHECAKLIQLEAAILFIPRPSRLVGWSLRIRSLCAKFLRCRLWGI